MVDGRAAATISVRLSGEPVPEYQQAVAAARAAVAAAGSDTSEDDEPLTAAEAAQLAAQLEQMNGQAAARKQAAREEKLEQRRAYELDNQVGGLGQGCVVFVQLQAEHPRAYALGGMALVTVPLQPPWLLDACKASP